jgi:hypothetical protein
VSVGHLCRHSNLRHFSCPHVPRVRRFRPTPHPPFLKTSSTSSPCPPPCPTRSPRRRRPPSRSPRVSRSSSSRASTRLGTRARSSRCATARVSTRFAPPSTYGDWSEDAEKVPCADDHSVFPFRFVFVATRCMICLLLLLLGACFNNFMNLVDLSISATTWRRYA